jgi:hypothetical protein
MKRLAFPMVLTAILAAGVAFSSASNAARTGISEEDLLRSGHTIDYGCGAVTAGSATAGAEPVQLAAAIKCEENSDGSCRDTTQHCGSTGGTKKTSNQGLCTNVQSKTSKRVRCACVR